MLVSKIEPSIPCLGICRYHEVKIANRDYNSDLHPGNILLRLPRSIDDLSQTQLNALYGEPELEPVLRIDDKPLSPGVPSHVILPIWLGKASEHVTISEAYIFLTDFGESFDPSKTARYISRTPIIFSPPEAHFYPDEPLSFPADIWTLACTIWGILGQRPLFEGWNASADWMTKEHVEVLGLLPSPWWEQWDAREKWFHSDGTRKGGGVGRGLAERLEDSIQQPRRESGMEEIGEVETTALFEMLKTMLAFHPEQRSSAKEVLESEWMRKWALPELSKLGS